jgi:AcrR family transcriptional regulator
MGSFYWHFSNRNALIDAALARWEHGETDAAMSEHASLDGAEAQLRWILNAALEDRLGARVEAALLVDSADRRVLDSVQRTTRIRIAFLRRLFRQLGLQDARSRATLAYSAYLGMLHLRRATPAAAPAGRQLHAYIDDVIRWVLSSDTDHAAIVGRQRGARALVHRGGMSTPALASSSRPSDHDEPVLA